MTDILPIAHTNTPIKRFTFGVAVNDGPTPLTHKVRSDYVEEQWLSYVGPCGLLMARRMDKILATQTTQGVETKLWAKQMGVTVTEMIASLNRLARFGLGEWNGETNFLLRRHWPEVPLAIATPQHRDVLMSLTD